MDQEIIEDLARRHEVSVSAVKVLSEALEKGNGALAQFNHPELGGMGQWSSGGMTMIGDMLNTQLKDRVNALTSELAALLKANPSGSGPQFLFKKDPSDSWFGIGLGQASASGSQNGMWYAYFPSTRRLAIQSGDHVTVYDAGELQIYGVAQQQSSAASLSFVSQLGIVDVAALHVVERHPNPLKP